MNRPIYEITSVKRESDGEIFSIGDRVDTVYGESKIHKINVCDSGNAQLVLEQLPLSPKGFIHSVLVSNSKKVKAKVITDASDAYKKVSKELDEAKRVLREANKKLGVLGEVLRQL